MIDSLKVLGAAALFAWLSACSMTTTPNVRDSNSNWLASCEVTADCDGDGTCICGLCTTTCRDDDDCESAGPVATCVRPAEATGEAACAAIVEAASENVCLAECAQDDDCRDGSRCVEGACWAMPSDVIDRRDGGDQPDPPLGIDMRPDLWALDAAVDFGEPVAAPVPETELEGELAPSLVGVWNEVLGLHTYWASPIQLEIEADGADRLTGTVAFLCEDEICNPRGPIPPATDPDASYPPGVDVGTYDLVHLNGMPHVPYRMFDGRAHDGRFTFWTTNNDVWRDWCPLQTPFPATVEGRRRYACDPDARTYANLAGAEGIEDRDLLCALDWGPCRCTADGCAIDYHGATRLFDLHVQGDVMTGVHLTETDAFIVTFVREGAADAGDSNGATDPLPGIAVGGELPTGIWIGESTADLDGPLLVCGLTSRRITLQITAARAGEPAEGTIIFGGNEPPPAVADASSAYPPGITQEEAGCRSTTVMEGFPYEMRDGRMDESGRLDFRVSVTEPYAPWCAMQESSPASRSTTGFLCLPLGVPHDLGSCAADPSCPVSASEYALCSESGVCACFEEGCGANLSRSYRFDLQVAGSTMRGVLSTLNGEFGSEEVSLRKVE